MPLPEFSSPQIDKLLGNPNAEKIKMPLLERIPKEAQEIANEIAELTGGWNPVEIYTADNMQEERKRFLAAHDEGKPYQPQFNYSHAQNMDVCGAREKLEALCKRVKELPKTAREERLVRISLLSKIRDDLATCSLVEGIQSGNDKMVGHALKAKYPGVDESLLRFADEAFDRLLRGCREPTVSSILSEEAKAYLENLTISPEEQKEAFAWALKQYGIFREEGRERRGFCVVIDKKATAIDVRDKSVKGPTVFIPADRDETMTGAKFCALLAHEIDGHARQVMNGERLFLVGGGALRKDDETMYEGLAKRYERSFMEKYFGKVNADLGYSCFYVFAVHQAERGRSFHDIFMDQLERRLRLVLTLPFEEPLPTLEDINPEIYEECRLKAWRTTYRVMRGHIDTSNPHAFAMAKDLAYLRGWLMDKELQKKGLGHLNEAAAVSMGGLQALVEFELNREQLPIRFQDVAWQYSQKLLAEKRLQSRSL